MIFNLFSNIGHSPEKLEVLQNVYWKKKLSAPGIYNAEPTLSDPVAKLLEDIKNRRIDVLIPSKREIIPSLWNENIKESVQVTIDPEKTNTKWDLPNKFPWKKRSADFPTAQQKLLLKKLRSIPVYTVVTNENELIMALSRDAEYDNLFKWVSKKYYEYFVWKDDAGPVSIALFFMNKEDAALYMHSVGKNDPKTAEKGKIRIQSTSLDHFYHLSRTLPIGQQAKLIADLQEIEKTVTSHIPKKITNPHVKQSHIKNGFTGTPIYTVNLALSKHSYTKKNLEVMKNHVDQYMNRVFFKLQDAYLAWEKICELNKTAKLPIRPNIEIYNLENYLEDLEKSPIKTVKKIKFTPSFETLIKLETEKPTLGKKEDKEQTEEYRTSIPSSTRTLLNAFKYEKLLNFYRGIFWLFTSDTLPTEDNAW